MGTRVYISQVNDVVDAIVATNALGKQFWRDDVEVYNALNTIAYGHNKKTPKEFSSQAFDLVEANPLDQVFCGINIRYLDKGFPKECDPIIDSTEDKDFIKAVLRAKGLNEEAAHAIKSVFWS